MAGCKMNYAREVKRMPGNISCDTCAYYYYDEDYDGYICDMDIDEDDFVKLMQGNYKDCPYYTNGDEYRVVRHQM